MITNFKIFEKTDKGKEVIYTLKTKAISYSDNATFYEYNVNILDKDEYDYVVSIENTPGSWYLSTLQKHNSLDNSIISISGDWICDNWYEIGKELKEIIPDIETLKDTKKYNL